MQNNKYLKIAVYVLLLVIALAVTFLNISDLFMVVSFVALLYLLYIVITRVGVVLYKRNKVNGLYESHQEDYKPENAEALAETFLNYYKDQYKSGLTEHYGVSVQMGVVYLCDAPQVAKDRIDTYRLSDNKMLALLSNYFEIVYVLVYEGNIEKAKNMLAEYKNRHEFFEFDKTEQRIGVGRTIELLTQVIELMAGTPDSDITVEKLMPRIKQKDYFGQVLLIWALKQGKGEAGDEVEVALADRRLSQMVPPHKTFLS